MWRLSSLEKKRKRNHFVTVHRSIVIGHSIRRKRVPISLFRNAILYPIPDRTNAMNYKSSDLQIWSCDRCWSLDHFDWTEYIDCTFFCCRPSVVTYWLSMIIVLIIIIILSRIAIFYGDLASCRRHEWSNLIVNQSQPTFASNVMYVSPRVSLCAGLWTQSAG